MYEVYVDWHFSSTHDSGARGHGFDSLQDPGWHFRGETLISLLSDNRLKTISLTFNIVMSSRNKLYYIVFNTFAFNDFRSQTPN